MSIKSFSKAVLFSNYDWWLSIENIIIFSIFFFFWIYKNLFLNCCSAKLWTNLLQNITYLNWIPKVVWFLKTNIIALKRKSHNKKALLLMLKAHNRNYGWWICITINYQTQISLTKVNIYNMFSIHISMHFWFWWHNILLTLLHSISPIVWDINFQPTTQWNWFCSKNNSTTY